MKTPKISPLAFVSLFLVSYIFADEKSPSSGEVGSNEQALPIVELTIVPSETGEKISTPVEGELPMIMTIQFPEDIGGASIDPDLMEKLLDQKSENLEKILNARPEFKGFSIERNIFKTQKRPHYSQLQGTQAPSGKEGDWKQKWKHTIVAKVEGNCVKTNSISGDETFGVVASRTRTSYSKSSQINNVFVSDTEAAALKDAQAKCPSGYSFQLIKISSDVKVD